MRIDQAGDTGGLSLWSGKISQWRRGYCTSRSLAVTDQVAPMLQLFSAVDKDPGPAEFHRLTWYPLSTRHVRVLVDCAREFARRPSDFNFETS